MTFKFENENNNSLLFISYLDKIFNINENRYSFQIYQYKIPLMSYSASLKTNILRYKEKIYLLENLC